MIPIAIPQLGEKEIQAIANLNASGPVPPGVKVQEFEEKFAEYIGANYAIMTSSGPTALQLMLLAAGIKPGDKVITTPFNFSAAADSIVLCGAEPVFIDVEEYSFNMSSAALKQALQTVSGVKAVLVTHLYGLPADMAEIVGLADSCGIQVFEDTFQALGARIDGRRVGSIGRAGAFSFHAVHNMTCAGGGMITTNDSGLAEAAQQLVSLPQNRVRPQLMSGIYCKSNDLQAVIGIHQLDRLAGFNRERQLNAFYYSGNITNSAIILPLIRRKQEHVYNFYTIKTRSRDKLLSYLLNSGIQAQVFYPHLIQKLDSYQRLVFHDCGCPVAEQLSNHVLSLPVHPALTLDQLQYTVDKLNDYVG